MSKYHVIQTIRSELDIIEGAAWYEMQRVGLGDEFFLCIDAELSFIKRDPLVYSEKINKIRRALVNRFPYAIFYLVKESTIIILAVIHFKRDPVSWPIIKSND